MKGTYLGEFEEIVLLAACVLGEDAYGVSIADEINGQTSRTVHVSGGLATLDFRRLLGGLGSKKTVIKTRPIFDETFTKGPGNCPMQKGLRGQPSGNLTSIMAGSPSGGKATKVPASLQLPD